MLNYTAGAFWILELIGTQFELTRYKSRSSLGCWSVELFNKDIKVHIDRFTKVDSRELITKCIFSYRWSCWYFSVYLTCSHSDQNSTRNIIWGGYEVKIFVSINGKEFGILPLLFAMYVSAYIIVYCSYNNVFLICQPLYHLPKIN